MMGFSAPIGLTALAFVGLLVLLHLRRRRQREIEVSSLLLWEVVRDETRRGRFRPNLLFALQVALLGALGLAVARPYWSEQAAPVTRGRTVLVFDVSASMRTIERGERRFDQARRKAGEVISGLGHDVEVMMIAVAAHPRVVVAFTRDRSILARALEALEPSDAPTRLSLGIQLAHSVTAGNGPLEIDVFTDVPGETVGFSPSAGERLRFFRFGGTDDNVALAALRVYQNPFQDAGEARGYALVRNYAHRSKELTLHVTLASKPVLDETLRLAARESRVVPIRKLAETGRLEAWLDVADALGVDNRALAFVQPARRIRVLAVSDSPAVLSDLKALSRAVPAIDLRHMTPSEFRPENSRLAEVAIFHGFVPAEPMTANSLYLYPPATSGLFRSDRDVVGAQILDWNETDPILRDLRYVEALPLDRARILALPPWAHTLIASRAEGRDFPLAFAGETGGRRIVCFAFDPSGRSLVKSENLSLLLLMLNALRWLTPPDPNAPVQVDVGESYREALSAPLPLTVTMPDGRTEDRPPKQQVSVEISRVGEYRLSAGSERRTVYANLFDADESDIGREQGPAEETLEGAAAGSGPIVAATLFHDLAHAMLIAGLLLGLIEWGYWSWLERRERRSSTVG
ncbi:MAG TPA: BatA and WFA domain-containing protein [Candidatus Binatia bacterium]|nr:BatA and WFA domain-containing protein [Candidatus Binatia bacterium]